MVQTHGFSSGEHEYPAGSRYAAAVEDDDDLIAPASPWPITGGHGMAVLLHLLNGVLLIGVVSFSPPWAGAFPLATYGERFADVASADLQWGVAGMIAFATLISIVSSSLITAAGFRLVGGFRKLQGTRRGAVLAASLLLAHLLGCAAGIGAVLFASGVIYVG